MCGRKIPDILKRDRVQRLGRAEMAFAVGMPGEYLGKQRIARLPVGIGELTEGSRLIAGCVTAQYLSVRSAVWSGPDAANQTP